MKDKSIKYLIVRKKPGGDKSAGLLQFGHRVVECRLGKNGITAYKKEGDHCTPRGDYRLLFGWHRKDRTGATNSKLWFRAITPKDGWCDDPALPVYNRPVDLPFAGSHEVMMRDDRLYDICIVLDHNIHPRKRGAGSAIFFHQTSLEHMGTAGCVAINPDAMNRLLPSLSNETVMKILI